ncbi:Lipase 1 [Candida viswanathii]|uniref:Lipase 1 n=1 Tax=Candida viswanathii TaxID=5486 RepID=A0A367YE16_9ASCO|nr:Lipase 1 [Candida viswanathii]
MKSFLVLCFLFITTVNSAAIRLSPPSEDPFYTPPDNYEDAEPGDILKVRNTPTQLSSIFMPFQVKNTWQLLVRSTDNFGNASYIVTTVVEPFNADPNKVVSYQSWEDSANFDCAPSYGIQSGASFATAGIQLDMTFMVPILNNGYYLVNPDYEGPQAGYTVGRQAAHGVLDSIRAVLKSGNVTGIEELADVAMWGYSGGSLASSWAVSLQLEYAPELEDNLIGVALGGLFANVTALAEVIDGGLFSALISEQYNGLANVYPEFKEALYGYAADDDARVFLLRGAETCLIPLVLQTFSQNYFSGDDRVFPDGFAIFDDPVLHDVIEENTLSNLDELYVPQIPVLIYQATFDSICPIKDSKKVYNQWCERGIASCEFAEDLADGHIVEAIVGAPVALTWLKARFDGEEPVQGCKHSLRVSNFFYPNISNSTAQYWNGIYDAFIGADMGAGMNADNITLTGLLNGLRSLF